MAFWHSETTCRVVYGAYYKRWQEGADYFVTTKLDVIDRIVLDDIKDKYDVIRSANEYLILEL